MMESCEEIESVPLWNENIETHKHTSIEESILDELKATVTNLYKETAFFQHSSISEEKVLSCLLNITKQCDQLENCLGRREKVCNLKSQKQFDVTVEEMLLDQVQAIQTLENKLDNIVRQSDFMQTSMYVLFEQLHFSVPHFALNSYDSSKCSSICSLSKTNESRKKKKVTTCQNFPSKLQELSLKMRMLECNMINCQNLSISLVALIQKREMVTDSEESDMNFLKDEIVLNGTATTINEKISNTFLESFNNFNIHGQLEESSSESVLEIGNQKTSNASHITDLVSYICTKKIEPNKEIKTHCSHSWGKNYPAVESLYTSKVSDAPSILSLNYDDHFIERPIASNLQIPYIEMNCDMKLIPFDSEKSGWMISLCSSDSMLSSQNENLPVISKIQSSEPFSYHFLIKAKNFISIIKHLKKERIKCQKKEKNLLLVTEQLQKSKNQLEKKLSDLQKQSQEASSKKDDFRKRADFIISKEREEFHQQINILRHERESLMDEVTHLKNETTNLQIELDHVKHILLMNKVNQEQDVAALRLQLVTESLRYEKALKRHADQNTGLLDIKTRMSSQEQVISDLENSIDIFKADLDLEKTHQVQELEEIYIALSTRDEECMALSEDLKKCVAEKDGLIYKNNALMSRLLEQKTKTDTMKADLEAKIDLLRSDSEIMRKKLIKLIREKDMLWQRTDHLTHLQKVQVSGRWMNDAEVTNCLGCNYKFKFTLRKHHCRLCGKIFCHSCANNWLLTAASRCQTRVCNECYVQHQQLKQAVNDGSSVHIICKDSEEEDIVDTSSCFDNKWDLAVASSMNSTSSIDCESIRTDISDIHDSSIISQDKNSNLDIEIETAGTCMNDRNCHFDVITDEEIALSLSSSSPYNPSFIESVQPERGNGPRCTLTLTRSVGEIESAGDEGVSGEIWILAGKCTGIPILCDSPPAELHWKFICDEKMVTFSILHQEKDASTEVIPSNNFPKNENSIIFHHPGLYILQFDNSFSRIRARKVQYTIWVKPVSEAESTA